MSSTSSAIAIFFGLEEGNLLKKTLVSFLILCVSTLFNCLQINTVFGVPNLMGLEFQVKI